VVVPEWVDLAAPVWAVSLLHVLALLILAVLAWAGGAVLAWAGGAVLALLVRREWESRVRPGSLVQAGLLGRAEAEVVRFANVRVIGPSRTWIKSKVEARKKMIR